jgi:hypothetical protein
MKKREQGLGAMSLPNRSYISQTILANMRYGTEFTPTQVWYDLAPAIQLVLVTAYGSDPKAKRAVQRCIQNMAALHGNPVKIRGRGVTATYVYQPETDKEKRKDILFTTETPEPMSQADVDEMLRDQRVKVIEEAVETVDEYQQGPDPLDEVAKPQVGDKVTFTLIGLFLDGTYLWREEATGHVGTMADFIAL